MSTIKLCGITALFGFSLDTNKHQDLTRLRFLLVDGTERTPDAPLFSRRSACVCLSRLVSHAQISSHFYSHDNQQGIYGRRNSANQHLSAIMAGNSLAFLSPIVLTTITFIPFFLWFFLIFFTLFTSRWQRSAPWGVPNDVRVLWVMGLRATCEFMCMLKTIGGAAGHELGRHILSRHS